MWNKISNYSSAHYILLYYCIKLIFQKNKSTTWKNNEPFNIKSKETTTVQKTIFHGHKHSEKIIVGATVIGSGTLMKKIFICESAA